MEVMPRGGRWSERETPSPADVPHLAPVRMAHSAHATRHGSCDRSQHLHQQTLTPSRPRLAIMMLWTFLLRLHSLPITGGCSLPYMRHVRLSLERHRDCRVD